MATPTTSPDIFEYIDYRMYLGEAFATCRKTIRGFSIRSFAVKADCAPSLVTDILQGRRNLTTSVAERFAKAFGLEEKRARYLVLMSEFGNARHAKEKNEAFVSLGILRRQAMVKCLDPARYAFWSEWHHAAIRELVTLEGFQDDPEWISRHLSPRISPAQARKSLELLQELGLVRRNFRGRLVATDKAFTSEYQPSSQVIRQFNQTMIGLGLTAPDRFAPGRREVGGLTLGLSSACYERVKDRIRAFKEETLAMVLEDQDPSETVCQLNIQLFPLMEVGS